MVLNFKEIPQGNGSDGLQDTFELFTRDFLQYLGYRIIENPDRGADGKKDLIVEEFVRGIHSEFTIRWLVSCKHFAHSGKAVKDTDEINIKERLEQHNCDGFMGVYSTVTATSLSNLLKNAKTYKHIIYDHEIIESLLLRDAEGQRIAARYFVDSYKNFLIENPVPANIFSENVPIVCEMCNRDLLNGEAQGIYVLLEPFLELDLDNTDRQIKEIHFVCKGECDDSLKKKYSAQYDDSCGELDDLKNPTIWIYRFMGFINNLYHNRDLSDDAFKTMMTMFIKTYPYVARHLTSKEKERVEFGLL